MNKEQQCNNKCMESIRSNDDSLKNKGLAQLTLCFKSRANSYLVKKGVTNKLDRDDLFNQFLLKTVKYPVKGDCSYPLFYKALHDSYVNFYISTGRRNEIVTYDSESIENDSNERKDSNLTDVEAKDCISSVFKALEKKHPKDFAFLMAYMNRKSNLKNLAKVLFISYGAVRERKSKVHKLFYQLKQQLCDKD